MKKTQRRTYILAGGIGLAVIVLLIGVLHQAGYVFSGGFLVKGGELTIQDARPDSEVYINNKRVGHVNSAGNATFSGIAPGERDVIVAHPDAWPWIFSFDDTSGNEITVKPLQVTEESTLTTVSSEDDAFAAAQNAFSEYREPSRIAPLERDGVRVWVEGTQILTQREGDVHTVLASVQPIRNLFWYGERNDAVVAAVAGNVFALDIRKTKTQNYQPIYTGNAPEAVPNPDNPTIIFVRDNDQLMRIELHQ